MDSRRLREAWQPEPGPAAGLRVCVVGDILLDVVVRLDGLIQPDTDTYGHAAVGAGGQAANVAAWIRQVWLVPANRPELHLPHAFGLVLDHDLTQATDR